MKKILNTLLLSLSIISCGGGSNSGDEKPPHGDLITGNFIGDAIDHAKFIWVNGILRFIVNFKEPMKSAYYIEGSYTSSSIYWENDKRFIVIFDTYTVGEKINLYGNDFYTVNNQQLDGFYQYVFPPDNPDY